ncbi:MAG: tetratricopeptide repeat protein [Gemmatimonadota bacterium]
MRFRFKLGALAFMASLAACASGGGGGSTPSPTEGMEEGTRPSENSSTQNAQLMLLQAQGQEGPQSEARYRDALTAAQASIQTEPGNPLGYFLAGQAMIGLGDYMAADTMLDRAVELYPAYSLETPSIREGAWVETYNAGIGLLQGGDPQAALTEFEKAGVIYRDRPEALLQVGSLASQLGDNGKAAEAYAGCLEIVQGPGYGEQTPETQTDWDEWEEICALNMAQAYRMDENYDRAADAYATYLEVNPESVNAATQLANALMLQAGGAGADSTMLADSAMAIYDGLLGRTNLNSREMFVVGIGLYQIDAFERAARAFARSSELNPRSRDAAYNWAQTLFLAESYDNLPTAARQLIELDPQNSNAYRLLAQGLLQTESSEVAMEVMEQMEALSFEVVDPLFQPVQGGGARLDGAVQNNTLSPGTPVTLRVHFTTADGMEAGTQDVTVNAPAAESTTDFSIDFDSTEEVVGFWYEVVAP